jgi:hypothetical protein
MCITALYPAAADDAYAARVSVDEGTVATEFEDDPPQPLIRVAIAPTVATIRAAITPLVISSEVTARGKRC